MNNLMNVDEILKYLPHRYPFLLVDRVLGYERGKSIMAIKNVTINEPFFTGHFPVKPVMPGVLIIEALAQSAGLLMAKDLHWHPNHSEICYLVGIDHARFKRVVEPGDQLQLDTRLMMSRRSIWKFDAKASVEGQLACAVEILIAKG